MIIRQMRKTLKKMHGSRVSKKAIKTLTLSVGQDTFVNSASVGDAYDYANIQISNGGAANSLYGLVYFDLSSIVGKRIVYATFNFYGENLADGTILGIKRITSAWTEATTYTTRPTITTESYYEAAVTTGNGWKTLDIKSFIESVAVGNAYYGLWLYIGNPEIDARWSQWSSSEGTNPPTLEIQYS